MDVRCDKCSTEYEFDEERVGANGVTVKCTACGYVFKVRRPRKSPPPRATTTLGKGPQGREWLVKKPDGQMIAFRELTTLQKWIVEGRIHRDDEISKNGETWKRLGNILELEPFFSVYEKARALNDLIERGGMEGRPVELRGSEVLAAMNPVTSIPLDSGRPPIGPEYAQGVSLSSTQRQALETVPPPPMRAPPPAPPASIPPLSTSIPPMGPDALFTEGLDAPPPGATLTPAPRPPQNGRPSIHPPPSSYLGPAGEQQIAPPPPVPKDGPITPAWPASAMRAPPARAAFTESMLSIPIDDGSEDMPRSDIVERFARQQRRKKLFLWVVAIVVLGGGGGALTARYGPPGNPVQVFAARYGLLPPKVEDDGALAPIEEAQRAFDVDSLASLERAASLLEFAEKVRTKDPAVRADHALVLIVRADALRRIASDEEGLAIEADRAKTTTRDPVKLRQDAQEKLQAASKILSQAFDVAKSAYDLAPDAVEPARALAEYYRVQQDVASYNRELARAKAALEKLRATDSALLYSEAAAARVLSKPPSDDQAVHLLEQALTTRPSMNRARVLLARIDLSRQQPELARQELDRVLQSAPDHQEATYLKETALTLEKKAPPAPGPQPVADKPVEKPADKPVVAPPPVQPVPSGMANNTAPANKTPPEPGVNTELDIKTQEGRARAYQQYMQLAEHHRQRDRARQALAAYEKAADLAPTSAEPLTGMGWAYIDLDKADAALSVFKRAIRMNDHYADAYYGEAEAHRILGQTEQAIEFYEKYLSRSAHGPDRKAAERALEQLRKAVNDQ
jgi:predicted Zn finger-like uncharacterized protein